MSENLEIGLLAPDFTLLGSNSKEITLSSFKGKNVVLYFYPKDDTPGCTKEACGFRDSHKTFNDLNTVILGVSKDDIKSHNKFIEKFDLPFVLLSDDEGKVCELYDVIKPKNMYGKEYMGIERSTFVIDKNGKIAKIFRKVKVDNHIEEVMNAIKAM